MKVCEHHDPAASAFGDKHHANCWQHHDTAPVKVEGLYYANTVSGGEAG
jgi:hypothetical protein